MLRASREQLQGSFDQQIVAEAEAQSELDAALDAATEAAEDAQRKLELANEASKRIGQLQSKLDGLPSGSSERQQVTKELEAAKRELETLRTSAQDALRASDEANARVIAAQGTLTDVQRETDRLTSLVLPGLTPPRDHLTNSAKFQELMARLHQIVGANATQELQSKTELAIEQLKQQEAENKRLAKEQAEKLAQAEKLQATMGCVMKIVMAIVAVLAVVASVLTGGFASALVGAALLAISVIGDLAKFNLVEKGFEVLMEHVIQPLIKAVAGLLEEFAVTLGADPAKAAEISNYVAMALVAAAVVGLVIAAVAISKNDKVIKLAEKLVKHMGTMAGKVAPGVVNAATKLGTQLSSTMTKLTTTITKNLGENAVKHGARVQVATAVATTTAQVANAGVNIKVADYRLDAKKAEAAVETGLVNSDVVRDRMRAAQEEFSEVKEFLEALLLQMSQISAQTSQAGAGMLANFRSA